MIRLETKDSKMTTRNTPTISNGKSTIMDGLQLVFMALEFICLSLGVSIHTAYVSVALTSRNQSCSLPFLPGTNYSDVGESIELPDTVPDANVVNAMTLYHERLILWNIIHSLSIGYSSCLLLLFLALGEESIKVIRKYIIYFAVIAATLFLALESGLITLAVLILQTSHIMKSGAKTILKLSFHIDTLPHISFCPINTSWSEILLIIDAAVFTFLTYATIAGLLYLKVAMTGRQTETAATVENGGVATTSQTRIDVQPPVSLEKGGRA